jgi:2-keto-3-deoxy-L-rhamnonate aldolase RhmA
MKPNALRQILDEGRTAYGTMIQDLRTPSIGQIMAQAGCDFLFFDMEHGPYNLATIADLVRVTRLSGITALVRVPDAEYHLISRVLDLGAQGIMIPRVETKSQVEHIVECATFPPLGKRGCSVNKGHNDFLSENPLQFAEQANRENLIILQIERRQAVEQIEDILSVVGVGATIIGPNDLALSLGIQSNDILAALESSIQHVLNVSLAHGIPCGIHIGSLEWLAEWQRRGMQLLCYSNDISFLRAGAENGIRWLRDREPAQTS